jgi:hypothetical protein
MHRKFLIVGLLVAAAASSASAADTNLVKNGDFETGTFAYWTQSGNGTYDSLGTLGGPHNYIWYNGAVGSMAFIEQSIATVVGQSYTLSFDLNATSLEAASPLNKVKVSFGDDLVPFARTNFNLPTWTHYTITGLVADSSTSVLKFGSRNDPGYNSFDNITLTAAVPEPETYAMLLAGLALIGATVKRRKAS